MNFSHIYPIALITMLLSTNLNAMELEHSSKSEEFLAKLTDNNKFELSTKNKENIVRYCVQRIRYAIDPAQKETEIDYKLSSNFMYGFLKNDSVCSKLNSMYPTLIRKPQDIDICTDMRLFYCFPQIVEKRYNDIFYKKIGYSADQLQQVTHEEFLEKFNQLDQNELGKIKLSESIKLAEDILLSLQKDVKLAEYVLFFKNNQPTEEELLSLFENNGKGSENNKNLAEVVLLLQRDETQITKDILSLDNLNDEEIRNLSKKLGITSLVDMVGFIFNQAHAQIITAQQSDVH